MNKTYCLLGTVLLLTALRAGAEPKWTVHEWGTFISLQNESGDAIGGINTDDEPVPPFVHRLDGFALLTPTEAPPAFFKGAPSCHPDGRRPDACGPHAMSYAAVIWASAWSQCSTSCP